MICIHIQIFTTGTFGVSIKSMKLKSYGFTETPLTRSKTFFPRLRWLPRYKKRWRHDGTRLCPWIPWWTCHLNPCMNGIFLGLHRIKEITPKQMWERTLSMLSLKPLVRFLLLSTEQYSTIYIIIYPHIYIPIPIESVWTPAKSPRITCRYVTPPSPAARFEMFEAARTHGAVDHYDNWMTDTWEI